MTGRARQVLDALRGLIEEGAETVCAQVDAVARAAGLSERSTRKAISELVDEGALAPTGERRDGTAVFRLFDIDDFTRPDPWSEAQALAERQTALLEERLREELERPLTEEERADFVRHTAELANRYGGLNPLPAAADVGVCLDARYGDGLKGHAEEQPRYQYGLLLLCDDCYRDRARNRDAVAKPQEVAPRFEEWR